MGRHMSDSLQCHDFCFALCFVWTASTLEGKVPSRHEWTLRHAFYSQQSGLCLLLQPTHIFVVVLVCNLQSIVQCEEAWIVCAVVWVLILVTWDCCDWIYWSLNDFLLLQPMPAEQLQKLKHYKDVLHRMIPYLKVPKERVPKEFNLDKVEAFEKQIVNIMETFKRRRQPQQQQQSLSGGPAGSTQSQPVPSNSGQSQQTPGQQADSTSMPRSLPQLQPQQQQPPQMVCVIFQHFVELLEWGSTKFSWKYFVMITCLDCSRSLSLWIQQNTSSAWRIHSPLQ